MIVVTNMPDLLGFPCITSTRIYKNRGSKRFVIYLNFPCLSLFTVWFGLCRIFSWLVVRDFCRSGCRYNLANSLSIYRARSLFGLFPSLPRSLSLTQVTVIWNRCAPKAGFGAAALSSSLYFVVCHLEPRKVSGRVSCKALRWDIYVINTIRRAVCIVQCLPVFSFHLTTNHPDPRWNREVWYCSLFPGDNKVLPPKQG